MANPDYINSLDFAQIIGIDVDGDVHKLRCDTSGNLLSLTDLSDATLDALEEITVTIVNPLNNYATETSLASLLTSLQTLEAKQPDQEGTWGYAAGTSGTEVIPANKRVLQITAIALTASATVQIDGGDTITVPYDGTNKSGSSLTIEPKGNLVAPTIVFTSTDSYFVEYVE